MLSGTFDHYRVDKVDAINENDNEEINSQLIEGSNTETDTLDEIQD